MKSLQSRQCTTGQIIEMEEVPTAHVDDREFRRFSGCFPTGVAVVTTRDPSGALYGTTMNSVTSLTIDPPTYLMCFGYQSRTLSALNKSGIFCINFLSAGQGSVSKIFASKDADKFATVPFSLAKNGAPMLDEVVAACEGAVIQAHDGGDHLIVLGHVKKVHIGEGDPLIFYRGKFRSFERHED